MSLSHIFQIQKQTILLMIILDFFILHFVSIKNRNDFLKNICIPIMSKLRLRNINFINEQTNKLLVVKGVIFDIFSLKMNVSALFVFVLPRTSSSTVHYIHFEDVLQRNKLYTTTLISKQCNLIETIFGMFDTLYYHSFIV